MEAHLSLSLLRQHLWAVASTLVALVADAVTAFWAQALSKRIHYGKFVAEAKFLAAEDRYRALIAAQDEEGIMDALTDRAVEQKACCPNVLPAAR